MLTFSNMNGVFSFYSKQVEHYSSELEKLKKQQVNLGFLRLITFLAVAVCSYFFITKGGILFLAAGIFLLSLFLFLVKKYVDKSRKKAITEKLVYINKNEAAILNGNPNQFDDGSQYTSNEKYYTDLDVFGKYSVYHLLNRTATTAGSDTLAAYLKNSLTSKEEIIKIQQAVNELKTQTGILQQLTANALLFSYEKNDLDKINEWLLQKEMLLTNNWYKTARWILPFISIAALTYWIATGNYFPFLLSALINWLHIGRLAKYTAAQHQLTGKKQELLNQYASILKNINTINACESSLIKDLRHISSGASVAINQLSTITNFFDQRLNMLVQLFFNTVLLYDIQCLWQLEKWKLTNKEKFPGWIKTVGEAEYLTSLATFAFNNPSFCIPSVADGVPFIQASGLSHPLINEKERIKNDFNIGKEDKLQLITGSNMSGKTTFLRSVGVNVLLAQCGAPVCADQFAFTPVQLLSSIRVSDSLQEHTSYFMAELKKLHWMVEALQTGKPSLVLIDEILRGTNSDDKTHGSDQFIKKILPFNSITLFATHDLSLGSLEQTYPGLLSNYCFESTIQNGELSFDYRLRKGIAQNKNASFLMEKMGII